MSKLAAIILAAGVSSRMGKFKPLLPVDGQTMAQRVVRSMIEAGADPVLVVTGYRAEDLEAHLAGTGAEFVRNKKYFSTQMLDSLMLGAAALPGDADRVLIAPADVPLVKPETIRALLRASGEFVRPCCGGTPGHPVLLTQALLRSLKDYRGPGGLRGAAEAHGVIPTDVPVDDFGTTLDSDNRDEYAALLKYNRRETGRPQPLQLDLHVCLQAETSFWGPGCCQFLELIQTTGSILSACNCMHMSYSKAWKMINEIERQVGYPILIRNQGGSHGGGSELTPAGSRLLDSYRRMYEEINRESQRIFQRYFPDGASAPLS